MRVFNSDQAMGPDVSTLRHCNGCGKEKEASCFSAHASRCKVCRRDSQAKRKDAVLADELLRTAFDATVEAVRGDIPEDRIVRAGLPTYPGVREARRELYRKLRRLGWPCSTIAAFAGQREVTVARALQ